MRDMERLLMVYGSVVFCQAHFTYDEDVMDSKKAAALTSQMEILHKKLEELDFKEVLQCGQKDYYSFL